MVVNIMKILYVLHVFYPESFFGTEKFIYNLSQNMKSKGNDVTIITYSNYENQKYENEYEGVIFRHIKYDGLKIIAFKNKADIYKHYDFNNSNIYKFSEYMIKEIQPDIIHIGHPLNCGEFALVAKKLNIRYFVTLTDFYMLCPKGNFINDKLEICDSPSKTNCSNCLRNFDEVFDNRLVRVQEILKNAERVFSPSKFLADVFNKKIGEKLVEVNNHGMDYSYIIENNKRYDKDSLITFGYAGNTSYQKGIYVLLEAIKSLKSCDFKLKLYGFEEDDIVYKYVDKTENIIELEGVFDKKDIGKIMNSVDVMIVPSVWYENYPLIIYESLASNVPVITSDIGGMKEAIQNCFNGFLFECRNSSSLKNVINFVVENPEILNDIKNNIKSSKKKKIEEECEKYLHCYLGERAKIYKAQDILKDSIDEVKELLTKEYRINNEMMYKMDIRLKQIAETNKKNICYIWGTGSSGLITKKLLNILKDNIKIEAFVDTYKTGDIDGTQIISPQELIERDYDILIISTTIGKKEVIEYLKNNNIFDRKKIVYGYGL